MSTPHAAAVPLVTLGKGLVFMVIEKASKNNGQSILLIISVHSNVGVAHGVVLFASATIAAAA